MNYRGINYRVKTVFQIANPTVLEKPGALMLYPIYELLFDYLALADTQISISYKTYKRDNEDDMQAIVDGNLTPGKD